MVILVRLREIGAVLFCMSCLFFKRYCFYVEGFSFHFSDSSSSFFAKTALALASLAVAMQLQSARDMALLHLILPVCMARCVVLLSSLWNVCFVFPLVLRSFFVDDWLNACV